MEGDKGADGTRSGVVIFCLSFTVRFGNKVLRSDSIAILRERRKNEPIESKHHAQHKLDVLHFNPFCCALQLKRLRLAPMSSQH